MQKFRVETPAGSYWTVLDDDYERVEDADVFLRYLRFGRDRAESTTEGYAGELVEFLAWVAGSGRDLVRAARDLDVFMMKLRMEPVARPGSGFGRQRSADRVNHILGVVRGFYSHGVQTGRIPGEVLPALWEIGDDRWLPAHLKTEGAGLAYRAVPRHRLARSHAASVVAAADEELAALLRTASFWRDRFLLVVMGMCGLRIGAALGLRRSDVHFVDSAVALGCDWPGGAHLHVVPRENPNGAAAKRKTPMVVPVPLSVIAVYERYLVERSAVRGAEECDFVFVNIGHDPLGAPMSYPTTLQMIDGMSRRAGLERRIRPHMLRHRYGRALSEQGEALAVIQQLLGHASPESTKVYARPSAGALRRAVDGLGPLPEFNTRGAT
ncbi:MAG: tyrosine-type recombinase/integrase [Actinomycetota bacterium]|nr:tyrosine-type recombinase/integrase [Actinomycetota bacterium]MDQ6945491.1 tyrosine-type recombinase/integrase [Actinomycetota bacterium]